MDLSNETITAITTCNVKKWRGRYYFVVFEKGKPSMLNHLLGNF